MSSCRATNAKRTARAIADFARNGRWGTCVACPVDGDGNKLPELCEFTDRYDHMLSIHALAFQVQHEINERKS